MGHSYSHKKDFPMDSNDSNPFDCLPNEVVEHIFLLLVDSPPIQPGNHVKSSSSSPFYFSYAIDQPKLRRTFKDLLSLEMVCRRFYKLIHCETFWLRKCHRDLSIVNKPLAIAQGVDFRRLYFSNPFHPDYNILDLSDMSDNDKKKLWKPNVVLEEVPTGCERLYDAFGRISPCYTTSYMWGHFRLENIPLLRKGEEQLISVNPVIEFSICVAARWDCSSRYNLRLQFSNGHAWEYQRVFTNGENQWHRITYRYMDYPKNQMPESVAVWLKGKDEQYWAGNYGTKFAQMKLRLALRGENDIENKVTDETLIEPEILNSEQP